ncbi:unnamed protein product [Brassica rapa]|uniref:Uncharacterized protein n=1 Tax=Brassica campestris TaxID=3711 RepID=A0A8D9HTI2_BRACM|nr:unnamed protein product [Brassica rapa]
MAIISSFFSVKTQEREEEELEIDFEAAKKSNISNNKNNPYSGFIRDHETTPSKLMKMKRSSTDVSAPGRRVRVEAVAEAA